MKKALICVCALDLLFILTVAVSGMLEGAYSEILYYLAFVIPLILVFIVRRSGVSHFAPPRLKIGIRELGLTLYATFPTLAIIFLISALTSLVLSFTGDAPVTDVSGNLFITILTHAILSSVLEEALFRYVPLSLISPYSRRLAVLVSALLFALVHMNIYQLFYAFFAGLIFATLDVIFDSIIPSVIIHFANNFISVFWLREGENRIFVIVYICVLFGLALLSVIPIWYHRREYVTKITRVFSERGREFEP